MKDNTTVKISSHTGIAAAVPYLLGFIPTESLVVIGLEGDRDRMAFTMRVDLPAPEDRCAVVCDVARRMLAGGFTRVLVAIYADEFFLHPHLPERQLVADIQALLEVREALLIHGDRVWSYLCDDIECCPQEGRSYLDSIDATNVAAAHVLHGRSVLMTREEVIASVAAPSADESVDVLAALPAAREALKDSSTVARVGMLGRLLAGCLTRLDDPRTSLTPNEVAQFVALLEDVAVRDMLLRRVAKTDDAEMRLLINDLARRTPAGQDAEVAVVLAVSSYLAGDGVVGRAALDRAHRTDPAHRLASIVSTMLDGAVHPEVLRAALTVAPSN